MADLPDEVVRWLRSLKLSKQISSVKDFENGFYFGEIFNRLGLRRNRQYHSKNDLSCVFHNYKTTRELMLENFGVDVPVDNLIYKARDILVLMRQGALKLEEARKQAVQEPQLGTQQAEAFSTMKNQLTSQLGQTTGMALPKKIQDIEIKLQKYRDEKVKHELLALEERKKEMLENERAVFELRQHQRSQLRSNQEFVKTMDAKIYSDWMQAEKTKEDRQTRERTFNEFMRSKKLAHMKSLRSQDEKDFREGLETFEMNCLKLGIDLEKDLDTVIKEKEQTKKPFNKVAFLERVRQKNDKEELARKEKVKRMNNTNIEQQLAAKKAEQVFGELAIIERYAKASAGETGSVVLFRKAQLKQQFEHSQRLLKEEKQSKVEYVITFDEAKEQQRQEQMRMKRIEYMQQNYERKVKKRERHNGYIAGVIDSILELTEQCFAEQKHNDSIQLPYKYWLTMMDKFVEGQPYNPRVSVHNSPKVSKKLTSTLSKEQQEANDREFKIYLSQKAYWAPISAAPVDLRRNALAKPLQQLISIVYPTGERPVKPDLPLYMPLKLSVIGSTLSGRKTQAQKLAARYGLVYIDPYQVIKEALILANPTPVDDKKAGKKEAKKPQQQKPEKGPLKEFGLRIKDSIKLAEQATGPLLLEAFTLKLRESFPKKSSEEVLEEFKEAERKEAERYAQQLKDFEDASKKKKDPKKPAEPEEPPKPQKYPYTKGFVLAGYPNDVESSRQFDKAVGGLVAEEELTNENAEKQKQTNSIIVRFPDKKVETQLKEGPIDYVFLLETPAEQLDSRNQNRKIDPTTGQIYHMTLNPPPTDVKGLAERLVEVPPVNIAQVDTTAVDKYYDKRGVEEIKLKALCKVSSVEAPPNVFKLFEPHIEALLAFKTQRLQAACNAKKEPQPVKESSQAEGAVSQQQARDSSHTPMRQQTAAKILSIFRSVQSSYSTDCTELLVRLLDYRTLFIDKLDEIQRSFLDIILRPDDKIRRLKTYQDTYNKLLQEKEGLLQIQQAKSHLLDKLDKLYDGLWEAICAKKDEAVLSRQSLMTSTWVEGESAAVMEAIERLVQTEVNKSTELIEFAVCVVAASQNLPFTASNEHVLVATFLGSQEMAAAVDLPNKRFPRLQALEKAITKLLEALPEWSAYRRNKEGVKEPTEANAELLARVTNEQVEKLHIKLLQILEQASSRLQEYRALYGLLVNRMDDWIIYGIKRENDLAYGAVKDIKKSINEVKKSNFKESSSKEISDYYRPYSRISKVHLPLCSHSGDSAYPSVEEARMLVDDLKTLSNDQYISYELLKEYFLRRIRSKLLPQVLESLNFDYLEQYFLQDSRVNRYELSTAIVLYRCKVPLEDDIESYKQRLTAASNYGRISLSTFVEVPSFFEAEEPRARSICLKHLLFEVFRLDDQEAEVDYLVETLGQLCRMQVETFSNLLHDRK